MLCGEGEGVAGESQWPIYLGSEGPHLTHNGGENALLLTHIMGEPHPALDTIEEDKEGSLSDDSEDVAKSTVPKIFSCNSNGTKFEAKTVDETEEKKVSVKWMNEDDEDDDHVELKPCGTVESRHPNIDRGWAWVVMVAVFFIFVLHFGLLATTGLYYVQMLKEFGHSRCYTAWMGSLINAFLLLAGPVSSAFIKRFGSRTSIILGSLMMMIGYLMSAAANSLPFIFFSFGVVVACGMNFIFSGQIITLAQYFSKRHSMATSLAMLGSGVGMFLMIRLIDFVISEFGWRISFIVCAAISIQCIVFASLIFPLTLESPAQHEVKNMFSLEEISAAPKNRFLNEGALSLKGSVSSLRLSIGAGYLSSSINSLNTDLRNGINLASSQHSFSSRGIGSNQPSFLCRPNSHSELAGGGLPSLRSSQHSFGSRGSFYGIHSVGSNPQSFSKSSQIDLHHLHPHYLLTIKDEGGLERLESARTKRKNTLVVEEGRSKCRIVFHKLTSLTEATFGSLKLDLVRHPCFWLLNFSMLFVALGNIKLFIIYKDLSENLGFGEYFPLAMSTLGVTDMAGKLSAGILSSTKWVNPIVSCSIAICLCGVSVALQLLAKNSVTFLLLTGSFGVFYGHQSVQITIVPAVIFGKESLVSVFGYVLFFAGFGALFGAPLAGFIVDQSGSYTGVLMVSTCCSFVSASLMFFCFLVSRKRGSN